MTGAVATVVVVLYLACALYLARALVDLLAGQSADQSAYGAVVTSAAATLLLLVVFR